MKPVVPVKWASTPSTGYKGSVPVEGPYDILRCKVCQQNFSRGNKTTPRIKQVTRANKFMNLCNGCDRMGRCEKCPAHKAAKALWELELEKPGMMRLLCQTCRQ